MRDLRLERNADGHGPIPELEKPADENGQAGPMWSFKLADVNGIATLDTRGVTIVFERDQNRGVSSGNMQVSGAGSTGGGAGAFSNQYSDGVNTMRFRKYDFKLLDGGNRLSIQGQEVDLSQGKKVVTVKKDGSVKIKDIEPGQYYRRNRNQSIPWWEE